MLVSQFITGLPPGALTVVATQKTSYGLVDVPSFDATFVSSIPSPSFTASLMYMGV